MLESEDKIRRNLFDLLQASIECKTELWKDTYVLQLYTNYFFVQNIVLIRDPEDAKKFYPRFNLEDTSSFKDLDDHRYLMTKLFGECLTLQVTSSWS